MKRRTNYRKFIEQKPGAWSQWQEMGRLTHLACCDCGLVHSIKYKVRLIHRNRTAVLHMKFCRHQGRTKARRKQVRFPFVSRPKA